MKRPRWIHPAWAFCGALVFVSLFADFLSSNPPAQQNLDQFYHPPSRIRFVDREGNFGWKPFIYQTELTDPLDAAYQEKDGKPYPLEFFCRGHRYTLFGLISWDRHLVGRSRDPRYYPLGTDELGRDVLARVLAGTRTSLLVVAAGVILYSVIGLTIGALAGFRGGWTDTALMRFSEFVLALPALYLVLALRATLPMRTPFLQTLFWIVGTIAAVAWPPMARGVRGLIFQLKNSVHVEAARSLGGTPLNIFRRHIFPFLIPFTLAQVAVAAPIFLLGEVVLSFLNVGFQDSGVSWGSMLRSLRDIRVITDFWWNLLPLCMVFLTLLSLNILSNRRSGGEAEDRVMRM
ncbi:MAG: ABC transporter permease [Acidobacteria bacterium]|nr:ABC transporter permease [Acidobacteriota bacterium]